MAIYEKEKDGPFETYHPEGSLCSIGILKNGEYHGKYQEYYPNGQLHYKRTYKNGKEYGEFKAYHANGQLSAIGTYKDVEDPDVYEDYHGEYKEYYENGQLGLKVTYNNGVYHGDYVRYHPNGQLEEKCKLIQGEIDGPFISCFENGQISVKSSYANGLNIGLVERYYKDGQLLTRSSYKQIKELKLPNYSYQGFYMTFFGLPSQNLLLELKDRFKSQIKYLNKMGFQELANIDEVQYDRSRKGNLNRNCKIYFDNGKLMFESILEYNDGISLDNGTIILKLFYSDGQPKYKCNVNLADSTGNYQVYYQNGIIKEKGIYYYSDSSIESYSINGKITAIYHRNGLFEKYDENEKLHYRITIEGEKKHGPYELYDDGGTLIEKGSFDHGEMCDGLFESYYDDGVPMEMKNYKNGLLDGVQEEYNMFGRISKKEFYIEGKKQVVNDREQRINNQDKLTTSKKAEIIPSKKENDSSEKCAPWV